LKNMCTSVLSLITIIVVSIQLSSCNINCRNYPFAPKCRGIILKKSVLSLKTNREIVEEDENPIIKLFQQKRLVPMLLTNLKPENLVNREFRLEKRQFVRPVQFSNAVSLFPSRCRENMENELQ
ncbi:hypothetical protein T11_10941, partial [Trichinella zimbabwensis]